MIELLVTIGILGAIAAVGISSYQAMKNSTALNNAVQELAGALRMAQNQSATSQGGVAHGVRVETDHYVLFNPSGDVRSLTFSNGINLIGTSSVSVQFERLSGRALAATNFTVGFNGGRQKQIAVQTNGVITIN